MEFFNNRYVQLALLTLGIGLVFWALLWMVFYLVGLEDFPIGLQLAIAFLGAGLLVYKFFSNRIF
ncbi:TPA: hypothetical protein DCF80_00020 [Candidatus Saccharibacteria bacterium]|nr:hypothetical protein [Candidatus Saccharibacteria bacterium]HRK41026.1 hypothetical protein [Candidatus Saccharibacteria bacterium]